MNKKSKKILFVLLMAVMVLGAALLNDFAGLEFPESFIFKANAQESVSLQTKETSTEETTAAVVASGTCGDSLTWSLDENGRLLIEGTGAMTDFTSGYGTPWSSNRTSIKSVDVGDGVTSIGQYSFSGYSNLETVRLPDNLEVIGIRSFENCQKLARVEIPESVKTIGYSAFANCISLTSVKIPKGVTASGSVFSGCTSLASVEISEGVTTISSNMFYNCTSLESVEIPKSVKKIEYSAFSGCTSLASIKIPEGVTTIGGSAFSGCTSFESIEIPKSVKTIDYATFQDCTNLTNVTISEGVTSIGSSAFKNCTNITELIIPDSVTAIGSDAFVNCSNLKKIKLSDKLETIKSYAFRGCSKLTEIDLPNSLKTIEAGAFLNCTGITELTIPDSVTSIGNGALRGMTSLEKLTVPFVGKSRTAYYYEAVLGYVFGYSYVAGTKYGPRSQSFVNVKEGTVEGATWQYSCYYKDIVYVSRAYIESYYYYIPESLRSVTVTDSTIIRSAAFNNCRNLTEINLNEGITVINSYAFTSCHALKEMTVPEGVTTIGANAYSYCSGLEKITLPESLTTIENYAFNNCDELTSVVIPDSVTSLGDYAFSECDSLNDIKISKNLTTLNNCVFYNCDGLTTIAIPDNITIIGEAAFSGCNNLKTVKFSDNLETIKSSAFRNCSQFTEVNLPSSLESIETYAFKACTSITELTVPDSVTFIGKGAFNGMTSLEKLTVPFVGSSRTATSINGVLGFVFDYTSEESYAYFSYAGHTFAPIDAYPNTYKAVWQYSKYDVYNSYGGHYFLTSYYYYIPDSLRSVTVTDATMISIAAFQNCSNLTEINLNEGITSIETYAFRNCTALKSIDISDNVTTLGENAFYECDLTVFGYSGSTIETYCNTNSIPFIPYEKITSIYVSSAPTVNQRIGCAVDTTGMQLTAVLADGSEVSFAGGYTKDDKIWTETGKQKFTVTYGDFSAECDVNVIGVTGLSIVTTPNKATYITGDELNCDGLRFKAIFADGTNVEIGNGYTVDVSTLSEIGEQIVTITYYGKSAYFTVTVNPVEIVQVELETAPTVKEYFEQDEIDTTGLVLKLIYNNGKTETVTEGFTVLTTLDSEKIKEVVVEYEGFRVSYPVTVKDLYVINWVLATEPTKTDYALGESLDTTGLTITEYYNSGKSVTVTEGFTCTPNVFTKTGRQIVTVTYGNSTATVVVNVTCAHNESVWSYIGNNIFEKICSDCTTDIETKKVYLTLSADSNEVINKGTLALTPAVTDNLTDDITFASRNESIATVDENGVVTAVSVGTTKIIANIADTDINAEFEINVIPRTFTVTWIVDGKETVDNVEEGSTIKNPENPSKTGYTFTGWSQTIPDSMPDCDLTFTATWAVNKYDAVFNANGGAWTDGATEKTVSTEYGAEIIAPESPIKQGYVFSGWSPETGIMDSVNGKIFTAEWISATDTRYTVETYTMNTFGEYEKSSEIFSGTTGETVSTNPEIKTGFTLNSEKSVLSGTVAADNSLVLKVFIDRNTYTFVTVIDGVSAETKYYYGSMISEPVSPAKDGYKFMGWDTEIPSTMPAKNVTVTAVFEKSYICPDCGEEILGEDAINAHIATEENAKIKATINIKNNSGSKTINYGETLRLTAVTTDMPADAKIYWYVDGKKAGEGETFEVSPSSGSVEITVKIVDSNGKVLINADGNEVSDSQKVSVNSSFWQKIVSFFKNLFGLNRTVVQLFKAVY